ncbi:AFR004Wp [Eremothecium gossypii ATCC 10895]|uniref:Chromatin structure-remodeling complex subunit SFH1 n=1 Tax=Eremothecium gossypii (strain ATCC 10895 / CBS 109.51 / FGSC 9923 / NRRL Y-1056) TaxID=284811 RepID=SFH1_EREGS|nr:AFR004Wp [Eremothecium gossypii ATCC 10895]Q754R8.1 RecName: Full=Chromatin structure-remodeling complex subunit SFH1; AltName: Full=RSC complex subunit SFH1; AltName: Full=SNF5 homolog 1 [Eremothecium gossypii ATCC 10895]AAS53375.1 AFR004Wp [Eremothecium gossypii ATCC 10895]AEY97686.1 FAFR004Wp [Eremothecium gossypii FDAG1]
MSQLLPQAYLTNFHNRIRNEDVPLFITAAPTRNHKRAKVVNYSEYDNDLLLDDFIEQDQNDDDEKVHSDNGKGEGEEVGHEDAVASNNNLPDLEQQDDPTGILRYPRIRETFLQSKIAVRYEQVLEAGVGGSGEAVGIAEDEGAGAYSSSSQPVVIPIRLNLEHNGHKIIDFFTWNLNDHSLTLEQFAQIYCQDLDFAHNLSLQNQIVAAINDQLQEYETLASVVVPDLHVIINLTCNLDSKLYEDNFEWNLNDQTLSPEQFAELVVQDLGLTREFMPAIAHALYESILKIKKDWLEGHLNPEHVANGAAFGCLSGIRLDIDTLGSNWCPKVEVLSQWEIEKREIEKERNMRRLKRESAKVDDRLARRRGKRRMDDLETTMRI